MTKKAPAKKRKPKPAAKAKLSRPAAEQVPAKGAIAAIIPAATFVQFTANSQALLVARTKKKTLTLFNLDSGTETPALAALPTLSAVALSPDSRYIGMGTSTGTLAIQSTQTGKIAWKTKALGKGHDIGQVLFSLDGSLFFAAPATPTLPLAETLDAKHAGDHWLRVHRTAGGEAEKSFDSVPGAVCNQLALSPDGMFLAHFEWRSNSVAIWHLPTRQMGVCIRLPKNRGPAKGLSFGLTVRHLYIAQQTQTTAWNAENGTQLLALELPGMRSMALIDHGDTLAVVREIGGKTTLELLKADTGFERKSIPLRMSAPGKLAASPDGTLLALPTAGKSGTGGDCYIWRSDKLLG